jgi:hypothetical protein
MLGNQAGSDASARSTTEHVAIGARALVGVAIAIVGVLAAANPDSAVLRALYVAMPQLADAVPTLITVCGALFAAFSQPPKLVRRRA